MSWSERAQRTNLARRTAATAREQAGALAVAAAAAVVAATVDLWLTARVAAGTDAAQQLAPLYPYLGVDRTYVAARALGVTALLCSALAVAAGLVIGSRRRTGVSTRGRLSRLHRHLSLLSIVLVAAHAAVPYAGIFPPFGGWPTATVPFAQPYSWGTTALWAESAGIIAFYLMLLLGPSYYLARRWRRGWAVAHRLSLVIYVLAVAHTFLLGSDFLTRGAPRVALIGAQVPLLVLLALRIRPSTASSPAGQTGAADVVRSWHVAGQLAASISAWVLAWGAAVLTIAGALGWELGGLSLQGG